MFVEKRHPQREEHLDGLRQILKTFLLSNCLCHEVW
nr:MAG TPA: hypothetical protein [Caudoviricetes sp.]DAV67937.1 MAG TPA: hypothetical protein [Caudoviricetes sp.]